MIFLSVVLGTVGVVFLVPAVMRALAGLPADRPADFVGFAGVTFAIVGVVLSRFSTSGWIDFTASLALAIAAGAIHPEILTALGSTSAGPNAETDRSDKSELSHE